MSKLANRSLIRVSVVFMVVFFMLSVVYIQAQDVTPDVPTATPTDIPTDAPTDVPTDIPTAIPTDVPTDIPTAIPTDVPTDVPTDIPTDVPTVTAEVTETPVVVTPDGSPSPVPTETAIPTLPPEPALTLLVSEAFDNGDTSPWAAPAGWAIVPSESGAAWQVSSSNEPLVSLKGTFLNVAVQARFLMQGGAAALIVRQSVAGNYTASVDLNGTVNLSRAGALLQTVQIAPAVSGTWRTLRLSALDGVVRVSVDGVEVIALTDSAQLPPGTAAIAGQFVLPTDGSINPLNTLLADDFFLWVKAEEASLYPSPTPIPTLAVTATQTPEVTAAPTETVTPNTEPTFVGKDTSAAAQPSEAMIIAAGGTTNDDFVDAISIPSNSNPLSPYTFQDDSTAATLQASETVPTCDPSIGHTVWFKILLPATNPVATRNFALSTAGSSFDTVIGVYTGSSVSALTKVACNDDANIGTYTSGLTVGLKTGTTYYIQVGGYNGRYGNYTFNLTQVVPTPAAPTLTNPPDNFRTNNGNNGGVVLPPLNWNPVANATRYEVQIDDSNTFTSLESPQSSTNVTTIPYTVSPALTGTTGTTYYWRVRAFNINSQASGWSAVRKFVVDTTAPAAPTVLTKPALDEVVSASKPVFTWVAPPAGEGATGYLVDVTDGTCNFTTPKITNGATATTTYTSTVVLPQGDYCWRVQSKDGAGNVGPESNTQTFSVFIATAPINGAFVSNGKPAFKWTAVPGATGYTVQVSTTTDFLSPATGYPKAITGGATVTYTPTVALASGTYYWRVYSNLDTPANVAYNTLFVAAAPAAPTLTTPANNSSQPSLTVGLNWNAVTAPGGVTLQGYEVQYSNSSTFATFTSAKVNNVTTTLTTATLTEGVKYYWKVRALFGDATTPAPGPFSAVFNFTVDTVAPAAPTLTAPADKAVLNVVRPAFTWTAVAGATYRLDVDSDPNDDGTCAFSTPIINSVTVSGTTYTIPAASPALAQGSYCWRVKAVDAAGNSSSYNTRTFKVFIGKTPADGAFITNGKPAFTWTGVSGAAGYIIEVATDTTFNTPAPNYPKTVGAVMSYTATNVLPVGTYYWRVKTSTETPVNIVYRTFFVAPVTAAPTLTTPTNNSYQPSLTVGLNWNAVTAPSGVTLQGYEVQYSNSSTFATFTSVTVNSATTTANATGLTNGVKYYWKVRALFGDASNPAPGPFSAPFNFTVDTTAPAAPNLTAPADKAVLSAVRPPFTWTAVAGTTYQLDIDSDTDNNGACDFSPSLLSIPVTGTTYTIPAANPALAQGSYCWRVKAVDAATNSTYSGTRTFKIFIGTLPADGAFVTNGKPAFTWTAVSGVSSYVIQVATDTAFTTPASVDYPKTVGAVTTFTATNALPAGTYYWRVLKNTPGLEVPVSIVYRTFFVDAAPNAPTLTSPTLGASVGTLAVDLQWNAVTSPTANLLGYEIQYANNATFANFTSATVDDVTTTFTTPNLTDGVKYYWKVRALFGDVSSPAPGTFSTPFNFTVDVTSPGVPVQVSPLNSSTISTQPVFKWNAITGAKYNLKYGLTNSPNVTISNLTTNTFTPPSPLPANTYYWQVQAVDAAGNLSAFSDVWSFKLVSAAGAVPILNRFSASPITLSWGPISWVSPSGHYQVQIDNNNTFASPEYDSLATLVAGTQSVTLNIPANAPLTVGTWYWRVRACSGVDPSTCVAWPTPSTTTYGTFTIDF